MRTLALIGLPLLLSACALGVIQDIQADGDDGTSSSTGDGSTGGWPGPISTVTTSPPDQTSDAGSESDSEASTSEASPPTGDPPGPPSIVGEPSFTPNPIEINGVIAVSVETTDADAVMMQVEGEEAVALAPGDAPGTFVGQIAVVTGLDNGERSATFTPHRLEEVGEGVSATFHTALPSPGSEGFWETGDLIGPGQVVALGMLPDGDVLELGHHSPEGTKRCYLRRRDPTGAWAPSDLVSLVDDECEAVDMKVSAEGSIFVLLKRSTKSGQLWWLGELPAFGAEPKSRGLGAKGEEAYALAERGGTAAVCGTAPTQGIDERDVLVQVFRPDLPGDRFILDHDTTPLGPHWFLETARDCVYTADETLVVVGDSFGIHKKDDPKRSRRFTLTLTGEQPEWIVEDPWLAVQSVARAVDVDDQGQLVIVGYICADNCTPEGRLWIEDAAGELVGQGSLGSFPGDVLAPSDVAWSPAGYAVIASAGLDADLWAFTVRAVYPSGALAWSFSRKDPPMIHLARGVVVGAYGEVWAGGFGANGYSAVANVGG